MIVVGLDLDPSTIGIVSGRSYPVAFNLARRWFANLIKFVLRGVKKDVKIYTDRIHSPVGLNREPSSPIFFDPTDPQDSS